MSGIDILSHQNILHAHIYVFEQLLRFIQK